MNMNEDKDKDQGKGISERFIRGLKKHNISLFEIQNGAWKYCGGSEGRHANYYRLVFRGKPFPDHKKRCICEHPITENCYITNGEQKLILGNCCIIRFLPQKLRRRTCEICGEPHKNRNINRCNEHRSRACATCGKTIKEIYKYCYKHYMSKKAF